MYLCHGPDLAIFDRTRKKVVFRFVYRKSAFTEHHPEKMCKPYVHNLLTHKCFTIVPLYWKKKEKEGEGRTLLLGASRRSQRFEL